MIESLETVVDYIDKVISEEVTDRKVARATESCSELVKNTDRLIMIGNMTENKAEISDLSDNITAVSYNSRSCSQQQVEQLKKDKITLNKIICHLKQRIGLYCATTLATTAISTDYSVIQSSITQKTDSTTSTLLYSEIPVKLSTMTTPTGEKLRFL